MDTFLNISGSASLALHAMAFIASKPDRLITAREIASSLDASEAHLHKVLKLLVKSKILKSVRGPKGGVKLHRPVGDVRLIDIVESVEGTVVSDTCRLGTKVCSGNQCVFGSLLTLVNTQVMNYLKNSTLSDVSGLFGSMTPAQS